MNAVLSRGEARISDLSWWPGASRRAVVAHLGLRIEPGQRVGLVGPSGSGKSTVLLALAGELGTAIGGELGGTVEVGGRARLVLQNPAHGVVAERVGRNVAFGPENLGIEPDEIWTRVDNSLKAVDLDCGRSRRCSELSGGEQQRLAIAGVLATDADLVLLDEPTGMLDDATARRVIDAVTATVGDRTMVVVEHRIEPWLEHLDRVVALGPGGEVVSDGSVEQFAHLATLEGVWMPGMAAPLPIAPLELPPAGGAPLRADRISVVVREHTATGVHHRRVLDEFSMTAEPGSVTALTGPSGGGKSTALLALGSLTRLERGSISPSLNRMRSREVARQLGWVPQNPEAAFIASTVAEEVERTSKVLRRDVNVEAVLESIGLAGRGGHHPYRLSGGEQRRLALVASLAHAPTHALLDEPTVGQDPQTWAMVTGWYLALAQAGGTVVMATHDHAAPRDAEVHLEGRT